MKRILLFAVALLLMVGAASAQPPQGPRGPREFHGPQGHFFAPQGMPEFQAPKDFKAPEGFRAPKNFEAPKDFKAPEGFRAPKGFEAPKDFPGPGFRAPRGPQGFRPHPGSDEFVVVPLTDEEVAERFARRLHLDSEKAEAFAPIFTAYRADVKAAEEANPVTFKPDTRRGPRAEKPTEAELTEMKAQHEQFVARDKAIRIVREDYKENFSEVLNHREYHWMSHLERDRGMFVKLVRKGEEKAEEPQVTAPASEEGIAAGIGGVEKDDAASTWYSLDGTKVTGQPTKSGIYVVDGKKVMVR
ncbi:MAG: hypothetical protein J5770_06580 [Bacteroidaceae bacterium]|nr:hypothetical protein [Bacteroidaceae bacterium]